jgi:hypothetical protein
MTVVHALCGLTLFFSDDVPGTAFFGEPHSCCSVDGCSNSCLSLERDFGSFSRGGGQVRFLTWEFLDCGSFPKT